MILLIDHYDSFVYNLARYLNRLGQQTSVVRFDEVELDQIQASTVDAIVLSPGPCAPQQAQPSMDLVRRFTGVIPILGVCLGHQCIVAALGGQIVPASEPMHGRPSEVLHDGQGVFAGLENPLTACRYHSLVAERSTMPSELEVSAWLEDETVMAIRHRSAAVVGIQFHPESVLTATGYPLLANFLDLHSFKVERPLPAIDQECQQVVASTPPQTDRPVSF
jgi:anthranilate synthase component 2